MRRSRLNWSKQAAVVLATAIISAVASSTAVDSTPLRIIEHKIYDLIVQDSAQSEIGHADVALIVIDDKSRATIPEPLAYWQPHLATVVRVLNNAHARAVGLDMIFSAQDARAIAESKQMAQAVAEVSTAGMPVILGYNASAQLPQTPLYMLASSSSPRPLGYLNLPADSDDVVRRFDPCRRNEQQPAFALGVRLAASGMHQEFACGGEELQGRKGASLASDHSLAIAFARMPAPRKISFADVLTEAQHSDMAELTRQFSNKLVIVGSDESQDRHATPLLDDTGRTLGMEIHAAIAQGMYSGVVISDASDRDAWLTTIFLALLAAAVVFAGRGQVAVFCGAIVCALSVLPAVVAWQEGIVLTGAKPLLASIMAGSVAFLYRYRTEFQAHRQLRAQFGQFVSPEIVRQIVEEGIELGGTRKKITVLFSDIRSFTTLSEKVPAEDLVKQLNEYLSAMTEIIIGNGGYLDKFIGDGILAIYGAPVEQSDAAWMAVTSATQMLDRLAEVNAKWKSEGRPELKIGIGIHTGEAIVGNIGSQRKLEYTAVGDTVNTASRVESRTKDAIHEYGFHILISGATADELEHCGHFVDIFPMKAEQLKGKSEFTELFVLRGLHGAGKKGGTENA